MLLKVDAENRRMKLHRLFFIVLIMLLAACDQLSPAARGTLVCNPINQAKENLSTGITVLWKGDTIGFPDSHYFHKNNERFVKKDVLWNGQCNKSGGSEEDFYLNYCNTAGHISFFNGRTLIMQGIEYKCRNVSD